MHRYSKSVWWFEKTLAIIPSPLSEIWEPTVVNLAHAYRKLRYVDFVFCFGVYSFISNHLNTQKYLCRGLRKLAIIDDIKLILVRRYNEAISYYDKALSLSSRSVSTYAGLAYSYHLQVSVVLFTPSPTPHHLHPHPHLFFQKRRKMKENKLVSITN